MKYWLMKSEPDVFSIDDLEKSPDKKTYWDGVRNYQARNYMRDEMKIGDNVIFYHSNSNPPGAAGICSVVKESYPDFSAFDPDDKHYDPKSKMNYPTWFMVDIKLEKIFSRFVSLNEMRNNKKLLNMKLLQRGNRLSVMPLTKEEFNEIATMGQ